MCWITEDKEIIFTDVFVSDDSNVANYVIEHFKIFSSSAWLFYIFNRLKTWLIYMKGNKVFFFF